MARIQLTVEETEVQRVQKLLAGVEGGTRKALYNAVERAQAKVRTETTRAITGAYAISLPNLRAATNITSRIYGDASQVIGEITFAGNKLPLYRFGVTPKIREVTNRLIRANINGLWKTIRASAPVSAVLKRGGSKVQSETAFIAKMKSGHIGVFERIGAYSNIIRERMGLATAQMAENSTVLEDVEKAAQETLNKRLDHEITRIINGWR